MEIIVVLYIAALTDQLTDWVNDLINKAFLALLARN